MDPLTAQLLLGGGSAILGGLFGGDDMKRIRANRRQGIYTLLGLQGDQAQQEGTRGMVQEGIRRQFGQARSLGNLNIAEQQRSTQGQLGRIGELERSALQDADDYFQQAVGSAQQGNVSRGLTGGSAGRASKLAAATAASRNKLGIRSQVAGLRNQVEQEGQDRVSQLRHGLGQLAERQYGVQSRDIFDRVMHLWTGQTPQQGPSIDFGGIGQFLGGLDFGD